MRGRAGSGVVIAVLLCVQVAVAGTASPTLVRPIITDEPSSTESVIVPGAAGVAEVDTLKVLGEAALPLEKNRGTLVYDNTVNGPTAAASWAPGAEAGDVLLMTGGGTLDDLAFTVYNSSSSTNPLTTADLLVQFYNYDSGQGSYLYGGGLVLSDATLNLDPGFFRFIVLTDLADFGILLGDEVLVTLTISDVTGGAEAVGQVLFDPPVIGASDDDFFRDGGWYWFGGSPVANFGWLIGTVPGPCPAGAAAQFEYIARVQVGAIDNIPADPNNPYGTGWGLGGYTDFTDLSANMQPGQSYPIEVRLENGYSTDIVGVWVDWNQDNDFADAGEFTALAGSALYYSGTINVPAGAAQGATRMRVRMQDGYFDPTLQPCGYTDYGEVEDYTVNVGPLDLTLEPTQTCYKQGDQVVVEIILSGNDAEVLGGLFFLSYDTTYLDFLSIDPGDAPFTEQIDEDVDEGAGTIDYTVAVPTATPPSGYTDTAPIVMARITFAILADNCDLADAVAWRDPDGPPPAGPLQTRLSQLSSGLSIPLVPSNLVALVNLRLDTTPPTLNTPADVTVDCAADVEPGLPYGVATGGIGIYYNDNGQGEHDWNQAYLKAQFSAAEAGTGAAFLFDNTPLVGNGLVTWHGIYSGLAWPDSQFGFDMVLPAPTADGSVLPPVLLAYDNGNNNVSGRILRGPVTWAINDYKPHTPDITVGDVLNSIVSSDLQAVPGVPNGGEVILLRNDYSQSGTIFTSNIEGVIVSDGIHHWYTVGQPDSPMSNLGLNGTFFFEGTLTYDSSSDPYPLMDFYAGTIEFTANAPSTATGFATATDNCTLFPVVWYVDADNSGAGCAADPLVITRTWYAEDECGNITSDVQTITVIDDVAPQFVTCPDDISVSNDAGVCGAMVSWDMPLVWDNCGGYLTPTATHLPGDTFPVGTTTVTLTATDACGNTATCTFDVTVTDDEAPTITCPPDVTVNADAGTCTATGVALGTPVTGDNCGVASVSNDAPVTFPQGSTTVTWTVADVNGNTNTCTQKVTVLALNDLIVDVQLQGGLAADVTRCITFVFYDCNDPGNPVVFQRDVAFDRVTGLGYAEFTYGTGDGLPCGDYSCVLVQDELHTLTRKLEPGDGLSVIGGQYVIDCTGTRLLLQGDLYDDTADFGVDFIDVVDLGVYIAEWGANYDSDGDLTVDGNTPCGVFTVHADSDGDGLIDTSDRTFITTNYLTVGEYGCCSPLGSIPQPRESITVEELRDLGLTHVARRADLNRDGVVDMIDYDIFVGQIIPQDESRIKLDGGVGVPAESLVAPAGGVPVRRR